jgi:signal transduction histidine kinase
MLENLKTIFNRLANIGTQPSDSDKEKLHKRFLVYVALFMAGGGLLWASICIYHGLYIPASIPLGYIVITAANLWSFSRSKRLGVVRFFQLLISLVLPFIFQWSLGGFAPSGAVMLWAMMAILGALTFQEVRITLRWFVGYLALTAASGVLDSVASGNGTLASSATGTALIVVNIIGVSTIVFGLMIYFVRSNELAYKELERMNTALVDSQAQLVQAEKMASIGSLTAGIAHEMNTPIGVINSNTDISGRCIATIVNTLRNCKTIDELTNHKQFQSALEGLQNNNKVTLESSARITQLIDSLKSFTRLDEAALQKADVHEGIDSALSLIQHEFEDRIDIVKEYGNIPKVSCYPGELNQVFMNILKNAVEAIEGSGTITIRSFVTDNYAYIQIEDTGVGLAPGQIQRIFDPGIKRKGTRVRAGWGLFASYKIVEKHRGEIKIESEPGRSTTVTVALPAV